MLTANIFRSVDSKVAVYATGAPLRANAIITRLGLLLVVASVLLVPGCATTHAVLNFTAPSTIVAGTPFIVTVTVTINGQRDTSINSAIHFTSSDPKAVLPGEYYFSSTDAGSHSFGGITLYTPGNQTIFADIVDATGINGSANITVTTSSDSTQF